MQNYKNINFKIAFTGIMLSLVLLFQYLEKFMLFADTFVKINISLIFIMATAYIAGFRWALCLLFLRFALGPALSVTGYNMMEIWAQFVLFAFGIMFLSIFFGFDFWFKHKFFTRQVHLRVIVALISATLITSILGALLNAVFFTPGYWWTFNYINHFSLAEAIKIYNQNPGGLIQIRFFGIPNYWVGTFVVYITSNIIKFAIVSLGFMLIWRVLKLFVNHKTKNQLNNI